MGGRVIGHPFGRRQSPWLRGRRGKVARRQEPESGQLVHERIEGVDRQIHAVGLGGPATHVLDRPSIEARGQRVLEVVEAK